MGLNGQLSLKPTPEAQVQALIAAKGQITFAEFMEAALYHPKGGFYSTGGGVGPDFFTSPAAHPAFGALIAAQLSSMWEALDRPSPMYVIESGAGRGLLAADVLAAASGSFAKALRYVAVDRAAGPIVSSDAGSVTASGLPFRGLVGCIVSNELIDAFPVHRFRVVDGRAEEIYVTTNAEGGLTDRPRPPSTPFLESRISDLEAELPDGFRGEVCPAVNEWTADVAASLDRGFVITFDYGYEGVELLRPDRTGGTLQTYRRHIQGAALYKEIGRQDMTADVDFGLLASVGEAAGLRSIGRLDQAAFLRRNGFDDMLGRLRRIDLTEPERQANRMGMLELVKSPGLGDFKVLVQEKNTGVSDAAELAPGPSSADAREVPLLRPEHMKLMESRYPHLAWEPPEDLWPSS